MSSKKNIVLIGYRCSGKTEVGKVLAREIKRDFVDMDAMIEARWGLPIETMVARYGWGYFRDRERDQVKEIAEKGNLVIATGGGVVMDEENTKLLKSNGWIIWLHGHPDVIKERMGKDVREGRARPPLTGIGSLEEIREVMDLRNPLYERAGDFTVDTGRLSIQEIVSIILKGLPEAIA